jgi:hypothetical protein
MQAQMLARLAVPEAALARIGERFGTTRARGQVGGEVGGGGGGGGAVVGGVTVVGVLGGGAKEAARSEGAARLVRAVVTGLRRAPKATLEPIAVRTAEYRRRPHRNADGGTADSFSLAELELGRTLALPTISTFCRRTGRSCDFTEEFGTIPP